MRKNFLIYVTANEGNFLADFYNFYLMTKYRPGVDNIELIVVVSDVIRDSNSEKAFLRIMEYLSTQTPSINLNSVIKKGNIGRDFSSVKIALDEISSFAKPEDYVMIRNRSSIGPLQDNWYQRFINIFHSDEKIGLVGNTINLIHHPKIRKNELAPHIQTYVFLSLFSVFNSLRENFPGMNENDRLKVIEHGEIGLSSTLLEAGYLIKCLYWPKILFGKTISIPESLPQKDIKKEVSRLPFRHRKSIGWLQKLFLNISIRLKWFYFSQKLRNSPVISEVKNTNSFYPPLSDENHSLNSLKANQ